MTDLLSKLRKFEFFQTEFIHWHPKRGRIVCSKKRFRSLDDSISFGYSRLSDFDGFQIRHFSLYGTNIVFDYDCYSDINPFKHV